MEIIDLIPKMMVRYKDPILVWACVITISLVLGFSAGMNFMKPAQTDRQAVRIFLLDLEAECGKGDAKGFQRIAEQVRNCKKLSEWAEKRIMGKQ